MPFFWFITLIRYVLHARQKWKSGGFKSYDRVVEATGPFVSFHLSVLRFARDNTFSGKIL
jgi:hypothetical protein